MEDRQLVIPGLVVAQPEPGAARSKQTGGDRRCDAPPVEPMPALDHLGVRTDLVTACRIALGVGSTTAYALAGRGELPFPVYRVGRQWVVPTAGLRTFLGLAPSASVTS